MEQDSAAMEKRFASKFLKRLLAYVDSAQEFIAHLGECDASGHRGIWRLIISYCKNDQLIRLND